jgi:4,4'-diaponeurosporenoate glycosyltransferase
MYMLSWSEAILLLFWLMGFYFLWKIPVLSPIAEKCPTSLDLSVIIPARNEARNIMILLKSLEQQISRPAEIIVVDDHSDDATAEVVEKAGCRVIQSAPLPVGWFGKQWACWQGALKSQGRLLLFLDADISLEPDAIQRLYATYKKKKGLVSVQPFHCMRRSYERLAAFFNIITMAGMNSFTPLKSIAKPVGAFVQP